jgi:thioredoxin-related protein
MQEFFSRLALIGATFIALSVVPARAAELVMFERAGCAWCEAFDREIAPVYGKTEEGLRAPLRRIDTERPRPADLAFIDAERLTPLFVLVDHGREIGRIRGYPGEDFFWGMLDELMKKLNAAADQRADINEEHLRTSN